MSELKLPSNPDKPEATWINEYDVKKDLYKVYSRLKSLNRDIKLCSWDLREKELAIELLPAAEIAAALCPSPVYREQILVEMASRIWIMANFNFSHTDNFSLRVATNYGQEAPDAMEHGLGGFIDNLQRKIKGDKRLKVETEP